MKGVSVATVEPLEIPDRMVGNIFVSYSRQDGHFVPLLQALLDLHDHRVTSAITDVEGSARLEQKIERDVLEADALILVLGRRPVLTRWMAEEVAAFHATKPDAPVVPVLIENIDLDRVLPDLRSFAAVDFTPCMLTGFQKLFATLGTDFLSKEDLRNRRRVVQNRRTDPERRTSTVQQRMQMGLLLHYCRATHTSVFEKQEISLRELTILTTALQDEAQRYEYVDREGGHPADPLEALDRGVLGAWQKLGDRTEHEVVRVLKAIAEEICSLYTVKTAERRRNERRKRPQ